MDSSSSGGRKKKKQAADADAECSGGKPARPHWRHRDPADTSVYVVHPTQFSALVQQLTGAASSPPPAAAAAAAHRHQGGNGTAAGQQNQSGAGTDNGQQHGSGGEEGSSRGKTLGQMHDECMAWANADNC